jgi:hypothetical protein
MSANVSDAEASAALRRFHESFPARSRAVREFVAECIERGEFKSQPTAARTRREEEEERFPSFDPRRDGAPDPGH